MGLFGWFSRWRSGSPKAAPILGATAHRDLHAHGAELVQEVIQVTDNVHVAVGFGLANSILIEGDDGVIIVDTMGNVESAQAVKAAFDAITTKPVKAIIYTHNHTDHIYGAGVFAGEHAPAIYAHATTSDAIDKIVSVLRPSITRRSMRQFGAFLQKEDQVNAGIGPFLETRPDSALALLRPTHTFTDRLEITIAGVDLVLEHAPGETDDHILVWLPGQRLLIPGDNFYCSFPNLYAIRGTAHRDVMQWVRSLDKLRTYQAVHLVPCHTRPLQGKETIAEALTHYRDAIQYVHDQTVRGMNAGLSPDMLAAQIKLPPHLAQMPYLQEFYGTVAWSVKAIFHGYLGWFGGNPSDLDPHPPEARAARFVALAGGLSALQQKTEDAAQAGDFRWVLELTDHWLLVAPDDAVALRLRIDALRALGAAQTSANGRHYALTCALELQGFCIPLPKQRPKDIVHSIPLQTMFAAMAVALDAEKSAHTDRCIGFHFPDVDQHFTLHIRRGVAEYQPHFPSSPDITVTVDSIVWKELLSGIRNPIATFASQALQIEGPTMELAGLLRMFQQD